MLTNEVTQFIRDSLAARKTEEDIQRILVKAGWPEMDVISAIASAKKELTVSMNDQLAATPSTPVQREQPPQSQPQKKNQPTQTSPSLIAPTETKPEPKTENKQPSKPLISIFLAVICIALIGGGVALAYVNGFISLPFGPDPEKVFDEAIGNNLDKIETALYEGRVSLVSEAKDERTVPIISEEIEKQRPAQSFLVNPPPVNIVIEGSGSLNTKVSSSTDSSSKVSINASYSNMSGNIEVEFLKKGTTYYVRLNSISLPDIWSGDSNFSAIISSITGKWIKITPESIGQLEELGITRMIPFESFRYPGEVDQKAIAEEMRNELRRIFKLAVEEKIFAFRESPRKETLGASSVFHYNIKINGAKIPNVYKRFMTESTVIKEWHISFDQKIYDMLVGEKIQSAIANFNTNMLWELWIDIKTKFATKGKLEFRALPVKKSPIQYRLTVLNAIRDINKPITVTEPEDFISVIDAFYSIGRALEKNPLSDSEPFKEVRDSQRISDLRTLKSSISLYLADVAHPHLCTSKTIYASGRIILPANSGWKIGANSGKTAANGTGWLPVDFTAISSGAPIGNLPVDPINDEDSGFVYTYGCDPVKGTFKLSAVLESKSYKAGGRGDVAGTDGGIDPEMYETGTNLKIFGPAQLPVYKSANSH